MNPEVKAKWVEALESGEYVQGRRVLHNEDDDTYCCLGVLCAIAEAEGVVQPTGTFNAYMGYDEEEDVAFRNDATAYNGSYAALPKEVIEWSGIGDDLGRYVADDGSVETLSWLNDVQQFDFKAIANVIKEKF